MTRRERIRGRASMWAVPPEMNFFSRISAHNAQGKLSASDLRKAKTAFELLRGDEKKPAKRPELDNKLLDCNSEKTEKNPKASGKKARKKPGKQSENDPFQFLIL